MDIAPITRTVDFKPTSSGISASLKFLPNGDSRLCLSFSVEDDLFIENTEHFQGKLQPLLTNFDNSNIDEISVYIADNDSESQFNTQKMLTIKLS